MLLATVQELRDFLDAPDLEERAAKLALEGASGLVVDECKHDFTVRDDTEVLNGNGSRVLLLPRPPVHDVTAVAENGVLLTAGTHYDWDRDGILRRIDGGVWWARARWYAVTYRHGWDGVTEVPKFVVLRVAARAIENPTGLSQEGTGGYSTSYGFDSNRLPSLNDADRRDLAPYGWQ